MYKIPSSHSVSSDLVLSDTISCFTQSTFHSANMCMEKVYYQLALLNVYCCRSQLLCPVSQFEFCKCSNFSACPPCSSPFTKRRTIVKSWILHPPHSQVIGFISVVIPSASSAPWKTREFFSVAVGSSERTQAPFFFFFNYQIIKWYINCCFLFSTTTRRRVATKGKKIRRFFIPSSFSSSKQRDERRKTDIDGVVLSSSRWFIDPRCFCLFLSAQ